MRTEKNEKFAVAFEPFTITEADDTETKFPVDAVDWLPTGIASLAIGGSCYYGKTEQVDNHGQAGYAPSWTTEDYFVICGENYKTPDAFLWRISWLDDENDNLAEITDYGLSGHYLGHRWFDGLGYDGRHYDDVLVVYTRQLIEWDENNQAVYKVVGTPIDIQRQEFGCYEI